MIVIWWKCMCSCNMVISVIIIIVIVVRGSCCKCKLNVSKVLLSQVFKVLFKLNVF